LNEAESRGGGAQFFEVVSDFGRVRGFARLWRRDNAVSRDEPFQLELQIESENPLGWASAHAVVKKVVVPAEFVDDFLALAF
jgi:hypothetical protein